MTDSSDSPPAPQCPIRINHILAPVDMRHRDASETAMDAAAWFARQTGARISVLTVARPLGDAITEMPEIHQPAFEDYVASLAEKHGCRFEALFRSHESVDRVIRDVVRDCEIDFVVMATHHPKLTDHLFGSHASQTALRADCSVLVIRSE